MQLTYGLLFLAFPALYLPALKLGRVVVLHPWQVLLVAALLAAMAQRTLGWLALLPVAALWVLAYSSSRSTGARRTWLVAATTMVAIGLALHLFPGFPDPVVVRDFQLSPASEPMTLRANVDKGVAGLLLLAYLSPRPSARQWPRLMATGLGIGVATATLVIAGVFSTGAIRFDPKWPSIALAWMPINLLLTCVFEEMLFRGIVQRGFETRFAGVRSLRLLPLAVASVLFGLVHAGGGILLIVAAAAAGLGYGIAYRRAAYVEAAIVAHFTLNAAHFFLFTYPYAAR